MTLFSELNVWCDPQARSGAENMAVDQVLLEQGLSEPLLRFYQWSEATVSFGYFEKFSDARKIFPDQELQYVRRWAGGGVVDHRVDQTYSLFLPRGHAVEQMRGNESYAAIHRALATSLAVVGVECALTENGSDSDARACFVNPVPFDILDKSGAKLAGAGQRRSRHGMLHQGSVQGVLDVEGWQRAFAETLCQSPVDKTIAEAELDGVSEWVSRRYEADSWTKKRP